jgi:hypothetical protein
MEAGEEQRLSFDLCQAILTKDLGMRHINKVWPMVADSEAKEAPIVFRVSDLLECEEARQNFFRNTVTLALNSKRLER